MEPAVALLERATNVAVGMCTRVTNRADRRQAILACQHLLDVVKVAQARLIADATLNKDWAGTGYRDMADWLAGTTKSSYGDAKRKEKLGSALGKSKDLSDAVAAGAITPDAAEALADAVNKPPQNATDEDLADLVDAAKGASPKDAKDAAGRWKEILASETEEDAAARRFAQRAVHTTIPVEGMGTLSVTLPTFQYREFLAAVNHAAGPRPEGDTRTSQQRMADGVLNLTQWYASAHPTGGRSNPNILITFTAEAFAGVTNDPGYTAWGDRIPAHVVRELAKNATLQRVVMAGNKVLDLGRKVRFATEDQYVAMVARDGCCRWGVCDRPGVWCDADHMTEWENGGTTDIDRLWLLCDHHHTERHQPGVTVHGDANNGWIQLADGTRIDCPPHGAGNRPPEPSRRRQSRPPDTAPSDTGPPEQTQLDVA